ncbi:uncharacterized protein LOC110943836 [Helianthus annuus]|uniref:uncharacterized protein LOC110943836 n=1 Tax=Helianthus annuus TaxID=4232 RepID=UPI000B90A234|nr:uncharacterized protein LOC110943836 [Helianthus annuus]
MYKLPGEDLDFGLRPLLNDGYILDLLKLSRTTKLIDVFVEHIRPDYEGLQLRNHVEHDEHDINENVDDVDGSSAADGEHIVEEIVSSDGSENSGSDGSENSGSDGSDDSNFEPKAGDYEQGDSSDIDEVFKGKGKVDEVSKGKAKVDEVSKGKAKVAEGNYVSDEDSDYIMDVDNIVEEYDVDMDDFRAAVDFDLSDDGADLDIGDDINMDVEIDLEEFDSLSDDENDTKMQKSMRAHRRKHKKPKELMVVLFILVKPLVIRNKSKVCKGFNPKLVRAETEAKDGAVAEDVTNIRGKTKAKGLEVEDVTVGGISGSKLNAGGISGSSLNAGGTSVNSAKSASGLKVKPKPRKGI